MNNRSIFKHHKVILVWFGWKESISMSLLYCIYEHMNNVVELNKTGKLYGNFHTSYQLDDLSSW